MPAAPPVHRIGDKDACVKKIDETMLKVKGMGKQLDMLPEGDTWGGMVTAGQRRSEFADDLFRGVLFMTLVSGNSLFTAKANA